MLAVAAATGHFVAISRVRGGPLGSIDLEASGEGVVAGARESMFVNEVYESVVAPARPVKLDSPEAAPPPLPPAWPAKLDPPVLGAPPAPRPPSPLPTSPTHAPVASLSKEDEIPGSRSGAVATSGAATRTTAVEAAATNTIVKLEPKKAAMLPPAPMAPPAPAARVMESVVEERIMSDHRRENFDMTQEDIHVCFCWGDEGARESADWAPLLVAVNSTLSNTRHPSKLFFHIITKKAAVPHMQAMFFSQLPYAKVEVHFDDALERHIASFVTFRKESGAREALASPFNFAPFYLDAFLGLRTGNDRGPRRLIYLDTDVVVLGDIKELHDTDLGEHALAAVEDCSQRFEMYIDFKVLKSLGLRKEGMKQEACVFNRGVFLLDVQRWQELGITKEIETYMKAYALSKKDLYRFGMSQPPWLLAIRGRYLKLGVWWNCRGLGRELLSPKEFVSVDAVQKGLSEEARKMFRLKKSGAYFKPYVSTCAADARLLHFNGALKPWKRKEWAKAKSHPLCLSRGRRALVRCADLWKRYPDDETEEARVRTLVVQCWAKRPQVSS